LQEEELVLVIVTMMIFGGIVILWMAISNRRAVREMEHRERLAMIQRGLIPAPEADPVAFEMATMGPELGSRRSERWRSAGITFIGLGFALMMLLSFTAGEPGVGIGVGGAFAVLGATLLFNSSHIASSDLRRYRPPVQPQYRPAAPPPEPPRNVGP
jgi:hypothetical protein